MNPSNHSATNPTSRLTTPGVGGERPKPGVKSPWPVPRSQGSQRSQSPLGCGPKSGRAVGPSFLDSYKRNCNKFCGKWSVVGVVKDKGKKYRHFARLGCKSWDCPICGPKKASRLRRAIIEKAQEKKLKRFLTLTLDPRKCTAEQSVSYIRQCWHKFRTYLKRFCGRTISFITILELQRSGYAHLHVLVDSYIPQKWIQGAWQAIGGGKYVNIKFVDIHRIAGYLSKYLTKDLLLTQFRSKTRRYTTSRGIKLFEKPAKGTWRLVKDHISIYKEQNESFITQENYDNQGILVWFRTELPVGAN